jgi:hypothetical protein
MPITSEIERLQQLINGYSQVLLIDRENKHSNFIFDESDIKKMFTEVAKQAVRYHLSK